MSDYPEHDKLREINDDSQALGSLIERLGHRGISLGHWEPRTTNRRLVCGECSATNEEDMVGEEEFVPYRKSINETLALLFEIDYQALLAEKDAMLAAIRA